MGMGAVAGVAGGGASPVQQIPPTKAGGPGQAPAPKTTDPTAPGGPAGAAKGADQVGPPTTGGGGAVDAAGGAGLNDPALVEILTKLVEIITQLIAALQAQVAGGGGTPTPPGGAPTPPGDGAPAAPAPAAPAPQVAPAAEDKKAVAWTVSSVKTGHTWQMTPGQGVQLKDNPDYQLIPNYADGTKGEPLAAGVDPETL